MWNPSSVLGETYVQLVLAMAPLVVFLAWEAEDWLGSRRWLVLAAALCFGASILLPVLGPWGVLPWFAVGIWRALWLGRELWRQPPSLLAPWVHLAAHLYLPAGAVWSFFWLAGWQPLGFVPIIVLLTGVHFHYAGFALPWLASRWLAFGLPRAQRAAAGGALGVVAGIPLVAFGITASQLERSPWFESLAATVLALSAFIVAQGYLVWSRQMLGPARWLFLLGGLSLALGMSMALLYGWRHWLPLDWVTIPAMYSLHGTLNSWGFCLPCILGNSMLRPRPELGGGESAR